MSRHNENAAPKREDAPVREHAVRTAAHEAPENERIARTIKILGPKAADIFTAVTTEKTVYKPLERDKAIAYVNAVADLVDNEQGLKVRDLNKEYGLPEAYDPIMGSGASRPTAMRSLSRVRVAAPEAVGSVTGMPSTERMMEHRGAKTTPSKPDVGTYRFTGRTVESPTTREGLEHALIARYGVEPSQVYFKLGEVRPGVAGRMQNDPEYQQWVVELRKATGELVKKETAAQERIPKHRMGAPLGEEGTEKELKKTSARLAKTVQEQERMEEEKFFEAGERMTRDAEEARRNLLELREELHGEVAELLKQKRTPAVQKQIEAKSRQIARAEARLRGEERGTAMPERASFTERLKGFWKGLFGKKEAAISMERREEPPREEPKPEEEPQLGTINELLKTDVKFRESFQEVLNATPGGEPRAAIDMVHKKLDLPFDRTPNAAIRTPKAMEYVEALAGVLEAKTRGASKAQGEAVARLMDLNRELDVTDKDAFWKKFMESHLAGWLWKKREEPAPLKEEIKEEKLREEPRDVEIPPVIVGDENPPGLPEVQSRREKKKAERALHVIVGDEVPPAVAEAQKRPPKKIVTEPPLPAAEAPKRPAKEAGPKPPTDAEIESRVLLDFHRARGTGSKMRFGDSGVLALLDEYERHAKTGMTSPEYPGWTPQHFAKAATNLQKTIDEWRDEIKSPPKPRIRVTKAERIPHRATPTSEYPPAKDTLPSPDEREALARSLSEWKNSKDPEGEQLYATMMKNLREAATGDWDKVRGFFQKRGYRGWWPKHFKEALAIHEAMESIGSDLDARIAKHMERPSPPTKEDIRERRDVVLRSTAKKSLDQFSRELVQYADYLEKGTTPPDDPTFKNIIDSGYANWRAQDFRELVAMLKPPEKKNKKIPEAAE